MDFIPRAQKRRLSQITKLSFESVKNILKENEQIPIFFVSKYGEIKQQYNISKKIVTEHEVSPALFSFSVFNTAAAQLTIFYKNHERAVAITCYDNFVDTAFKIGVIYFTRTCVPLFLMITGVLLLSYKYNIILLKTHIQDTF